MAMDFDQTWPQCFFIARSEGSRFKVDLWTTLVEYNTPYQSISTGNLHQRMMFDFSKQSRAFYYLLVHRQLSNSDSNIARDRQAGHFVFSL